MKETNIFETMKQEIINSQMPDDKKERMLKNLLEMKNRNLNIMIVGGTGCGKSSTINALFNYKVANVGEGVDPETMEIQKYELDHMTLWDTPGLGDGKEKDRIHAKKIIDKLTEKGPDGNALIDLVLVILDGASRDMGTSYELINNVIIPNLGAEQKERILVAINKTDLAKPRHWDYTKNEPDEVLVTFLNEKVESVRKRVLESTGVTVDPIYYCAGETENGVQSKPYNLSKVLAWMVEKTPSEKRAVYVNNLNQNNEMWEDDDDLDDYGRKTRENIWGSLMEGVTVGAEIGGRLGSVFGKTGEIIGRVAGGIIGGIASLFGF